MTYSDHWCHDNFDRIVALVDDTRGNFSTVDYDRVEREEIKKELHRKHEINQHLESELKKRDELLREAILVLDKVSDKVTFDLVEKLLIKPEIKKILENK